MTLTLAIFAGVAIGAGAVAQAAAPSALPVPTKDPFYRYTGSTPLAKLAPGTVLKRRSVTIVISGSSKPFSAFQVLYRTSNELGQPSATVATVIKPQVPAASIHLVSYQTFYDALGAQCDPSYTLRGGNPSYTDAQDDALFMESYLEAGDYVVDSDYEGEHLDWTAGYESGYDTLDAIRAAENTLSAPSSTPVGLVGYSGGSIASEWAAELAPAYAPKLNLVGVAIGGVPVDFAHNLNYINGSAGWSGIIPGTLVALTRAFHLKLTPYLSAYGRKLAAAAAHACINTLYGSTPGLKVSRLLKPKYQSPLKIPSFVRVVNKLIMGSAPGHPREPIFMVVGDADGTGDGVMVTADDEALAHEYCRQGVTMDFTIEQGQSHTDAAIPFEPAAVSYLADRFAGAPAPSNCSSIGVGNSIAPLPIPCPFASGAIHGRTLSPITLGDTRAQVARADKGHVTNHRYEQFVCLQPTGLRVAYAQPKLLSRLPRATRAAMRGRVVWISTSGTSYALQGVRPGVTLSDAKRHLRLGRPVRVGANTWYFMRAGATQGVLKTRRGKVLELGITLPVVARRLSTELALLHTIA